MPSTHYTTRAHTKIVATVGPACRSPEKLKALVEAGVDVLRLNMAHGAPAEHEEVLGWIRKLRQEHQRGVAVLVDLAGPKIRLGELPGGELYCRLNEQVRFVRGEKSAEPGVLTTTYDQLIDELRVGDRVMLADGTVALEVVERPAGAVVCRVVQEGLIRSRQGVNLPGVALSLPAMNRTDREHALWAAKQGVDFIGLSFVRSAREVEQLKALLEAHDAHAHVIAKIEKPEALDRLESIVSAADGIMVARGDLGVEIDVARMSVVQKQIVSMCTRRQKPVIIATQMLDSMQRSPRPTRAEVTDVANAILDGCDACMLSGETAVGDFPVEAVQMMNRIALATEPLLHDRPPPQQLSDFKPHDLHKVTHAVVYGASQIAYALKARLMVVVSSSGTSALALSKLRPSVPILGVSAQEATCRQMCLYWGIIPMPGAPTTDSIDLLQYVQRWGCENDILQPGDDIVLVAGVGLASQGHNMVRVHEVGRSVSREEA